MNGAEIQLYNFEKICRLCLNEKRNLIEIFESHLGVKSISLQQKIMACAAIDLHINDGLPTKICFKCLSNVNAAFEFRVLCEKTDKKLRDTNNLISNNVDLGRNIGRRNCNSFIVQQKGEIFTNKISPENLSQVFLIKKQHIPNSKEKLNKSFLHVNDENNKEKLKSAIITDTHVYDAPEVSPSGRFESLNCFQQYQEKSDKVIQNENSLIIQDVTKVTCNVVNDFCEKKEIKMNNNKIKNAENFKLDRRKSPCPYCNKMLMRMDEHIRLLHRNRVYICTKQGCGAEFSTLKNLQSHQLRCYDIEKAYKCYKCAKEFHRNSNFKAHIRRHSNKKEFQCQLCDKAFVDSTGLRRHFLKHHEPEQEIFVSGCCGKKFKSKEGLKKHINKSICGLKLFQLIDSGFVTNLKT